MLNYPYLPTNIKDALDRYVLKHEELGGFCMAVLRNDLIGTVNRADCSNRATEVLRDIVLYVHNELPAPVLEVDRWLIGCARFPGIPRLGETVSDCIGAHCPCLCHRWTPPV